MIARIQQVLFLLIAAPTWMGAFALYHANHPAAALALIVGGVLVHAVVLALQFVCAWQVNSRTKAPMATPSEALRAWLGEAIHAPRVFFWRQPFRTHAEPDALDVPQHAEHGVVLVHGFFCNRAVWNRWIGRLRKAGVPCVAITLEPAFGSIDDYTALIESAVVRLEAATGQPPVIVAHSMGGLAVRRWWCDHPPSRIRRLVTIGTPHRGTWLARWGVSRNARQMRVGSRWLQQLSAKEHPDIVARMTCFYGQCDNIVFPTMTATYPGADNHHLQAVAHVHMIDHPAPYAEVLRHVGLTTAA